MVNSIDLIKLREDIKKSPELIYHSQTFRFYSTDVDKFLWNLIVQYSKLYNLTYNKALKYLLMDLMEKSEYYIDLANIPSSNENALEST